MIKLDNYRRDSVILIAFISFGIGTVGMAMWGFWIRRPRKQLKNRRQNPLFTWPSEVSWSSDKVIHDQFLLYVRKQDQVKVEYDGLWYNATIIAITDDEIGKNIKIRYNPVNNSKGKMPFWSNEEWFKSKNGELVQHNRLIYQGKKYKNRQGENKIWNSPEIRPRTIGDIRVNDHVFININPNKRFGEWRRCKVYEKAVKIRVRELLNGKWHSFENRESDRRKIGFNNFGYNPEYSVPNRS